MPVTSFSTDFVNTIKSFLPINCGVPESVLSSVSPIYRVTIASVNTTVASQAGSSANADPTVTVTGWLQEKVEVSVSSNWEGLSDIFGGMEGIADTVVQGVTTLAGQTRSLASTVASRRKWSGSSPITLNLQLKFEALNDVWKEVLLPCMCLQKLVVPAKGKGTGGFFLIPPGPNPFKVDTKDYWGDTIRVDIGGFLIIENAIVKSVDVVYENRMSTIGPIGASAKITIESYELLTKQGIDEMYPLRAAK